MSAPTVRSRGKSYVLAQPGDGAHHGESVKFPDLATATSWVQRVVHDDPLGAFAMRQLVGASTPYSVGLKDKAAWTNEAALLLWQELLVLLHKTTNTTCTIKTTGTLTLSEVSWGETASLYPHEANLYKPSKWDQTKVCQLMHARAAIHDIAKRNTIVQKNSVMKGELEKMMLPYHATENFPKLDPEITQEVKWFYIASAADGPEVHPGTTGTKTVKVYGPFWNVGGGDVKRGACWVRCYALA